MTIKKSPESAFNRFYEALKISNDEMEQLIYEYAVTIGDFETVENLFFEKDFQPVNRRILSCAMKPNKITNNDTDTISSRVAALEFIDTIESSSMFHLKNPPKNVSLEILKEGGTQSHLDLDLQALPLLMP